MVMPLPPGIAPPAPEDLGALLGASMGGGAPPGAPPMGGPPPEAMAPPEGAPEGPPPAGGEQDELSAVQDVIQELHELLTILKDPQMTQIATTCMANLTKVQTMLMQRGGVGR